MRRREGAQIRQSATVSVGTGSGVAWGCGGGAPIEPGDSGGDAVRGRCGGVLRSRHYFDQRHNDAIGLDARYRLARVAPRFKK